MAIGITGFCLFALIGVIIFIGGVERIGSIEDPKIIRRFAYFFFALAFLAGLLDSTQIS